jgi:hypothetical protein
MPITRGPFDIKWGDNELDNVESVDVEYSNDREDVITLQGRTLIFDGNQKVEAVATLVGPDIPALAAILPQYFVANGQKLSTGETVQHAQGAIDVVPRACDEDLIYNNFDIISCATPGVVHRINNARTTLDDVDFSEKISKYMIRIIGEAPKDEATMQVFRDGKIKTIS